MKWVGDIWIVLALPKILALTASDSLSQTPLFISKHTIPWFLKNYWRYLLVPIGICLIYINLGVYVNWIYIVIIGKLFKLIDIFSGFRAKLSIIFGFVFIIHFSREKGFIIFIKSQSGTCIFLNRLDWFLTAFNYGIGSTTFSNTVCFWNPEKWYELWNYISYIWIWYFQFRINLSGVPCQHTSPTRDYGM